MKRFTSKSQKIGEIGENLACKFLMKNKHEIIERNYTKKYGEIDIVAKKDNCFHFVEVKTVSCEIGENNVIHETIIRPEENVHPMKLRRLLNTIQSYLFDKQIHEDIPWQLDLACVYLDSKTKKAKVKMIENIIG